MAAILFGPAYRSTARALHRVACRRQTRRTPKETPSAQRTAGGVVTLAVLFALRPTAKTATACASATATNGRSSSCPRCAGEWPLPSVLRPSVPTSGGRQRLSRPFARPCAPVPSRCVFPGPTRSSCRRRTSCSRSPRPAAPPPSATRRASRSPPLYGGPAAAAWPCTPTCHRVALQSPHSSPGQRRARTEAGAVKGVTLEKKVGGTGARAPVPAR